MCNMIHKTLKDTQRRAGTWEPRFEHIPEEGSGWKVFDHYDYRLRSLTYSSYTEDSEGWISWSRSYKGDGFCFFLSKGEALDAAKKWHISTIVKKIKYQQGLGSFLSPELDNKMRRFVIAKRFRLTNPNKRKGEAL